MRLGKWAVLSAIVAICPTLGIAQAPSIIPKPAHATRGEGSLDISHGLAFDPRTADRDVLSVVSYLKTLLAATHGPAIISGKNSGIPQLVISHRAPRLKPGSTVDESYELTLTPNEIRISASDRAGYLYGAISLWQMLSDSGGKVAAWTIEDEPRFRWRALMLDSARHMQSEQFILQLLDYMAEHKLNVFHWHLADDQGWRLEIKRYPRLTSVAAYRPQTMPSYDPNSKAPKGPYGGFYTQDQVRRIVAYAQARNITVVPEIEMPGHATAPLVAYPEFSSAADPLRTMPVGWGIYPNLYNPTDATFEFLHNVLDEVMTLFPGQYIHLGGDEAVKLQWKANPEVQQKMHALGIKDENAMQGWFMTQMEAYLNAHGRRMVGWDEILDAGVSKSATVMAWRGMKGGIAAAKSGHDVVLAPSRPLYFNYRQSDAIDEPAGRDPVNSLADVYNFDANPHDLTPSEQVHILGVQGSLWTEYVLTEDRVEHMLFPRAAALAELGWSPSDQHDFKDFLHRLPADNRRAEEAGLNPAQSVFEVAARVVPVGDGTRAMLTLSTQENFGEIHYTLDGSAVTTTSPAFKHPLQIELPTSLHARAFDGSTPLGNPIAQHLTLASSLSRDSRELDSCTNSAGIQMEQDPPRNPERPVFRVVFSHPCWLYRNADMDRFNDLALTVGSIPYIFRTPDKPLPEPSTDPTTQAQIAIHLDSCKGPLLAAVPLQPAYHKDGAIELPPITFPRQKGEHDLCFDVEKADPATVWLIHTVQPLPH